MTSEAKEAMDQLQSIRCKTQDIESALNERIPRQRGPLAALVSFYHWMLHSPLPSNNAAREKEATVRIRRELGAFDYRVKEQAELLTRHLLSLDNILSYGDASVKEERKKLVTYIQHLLEVADKMKDSSSRLKDSGEKAIAAFPGFPEEEKEPTCSETESPSEDEVEEPDHVSDTASEAEEEDNQMEEEPVSEAEDEDNQVEEESLPTWHPKYQFEKDHSGLYLYIRLPGVNKKDMDVRYSEYSGILRVAGYKLPTKRDLQLTKLTGKPSFGRFEVKERLPMQQLDMDEATQQLYDDGTFEIFMPWYRHPVRRPAQMFGAPGFFW